MPNDCWSEVLFFGSTETIRTLLLTHLDFSHLFESDHIEYLTHFQVKHLHHSKHTALFKLHSAWTPPFSFLKLLVEKFPELWIRCLWDEEGGEGGAWICDASGVKELSWQGPCIEAFAIDSS
jgi:hypothetical protein